jgi:hypothetical protein
MANNAETGILMLSAAEYVCASVNYRLQKEI